MAVASCMAIIQLTMIPAYFVSCTCLTRISLSRLASATRVNNSSEYDILEELSAPPAEPMDFEKSIMSDFTSKRSMTGVTEDSRPSSQSYYRQFASDQNDDQSHRRR